ncbi:MAG: hypothetical protein HYW70_02515 [Candidatus Nealsonbacteria bacterium]|nr:hypothetical protein [Candidatus Nealsonbacteria bacterium]
MEVRIERGVNGPSIVIKGLEGMENGADTTIYSGIVEHYCKHLSVNELGEVVRQTAAQLAILDRDDIIPIHAELVEEVKGVFGKRNGKSQKFSAPLRVQLKPSFSCDRMPDIVITGLSGREFDYYILHSLVKSCAKDFSTNELRQIVLDLEMQLATADSSTDGESLLGNMKESGLLDQLKDFIRERVGDKPKFSTAMRTKIECGPTGPRIIITGLSRNGWGKDYIFESLVEYCCSDFSIDEIRQVVWELERQFASRNPDDIPLSYAEMVDRLKKVILQRRDIGL